MFTKKLLATSPQKNQRVHHVKAASSPHTPASVKKSYNIILQTKDGLQRKGVLTLHPNAKGNVVLCHPAAHDKTFMEQFDEKVFADYNCIRFDFRRHGEEDGTQLTTIGLEETNEIEAAVELLKKNDRTKNLPTYGFGISMGGAALIEAESKKPMFDGLIIQSTFDSLRKQIVRSNAFFRLPLMHNLIFREPTRSIARRRYRVKLCKVMPMESIKSIKTPVFIMHAKDDNLIPLEACERLIKAGPSVKKVWTPETGEHTKMFSILGDEYTKQCNDFLGSLSTQNKDVAAKQPLSVKASEKTA